MFKKERGLGKGLDALISRDVDFNLEGKQVNEVSIEKIIAREGQPRKSFDEESLNDLAESIRVHGILQPVLLRTKGKQHEIVAGERRWRAAIIAGLVKIPAIILELDEQQIAEISLIENIQREDLSVIEEANAYKQLIEYHQYTQEELARKIGKSRTYITNILRILLLPQEILNMIENKEISPGHARTLLSLRTEEQLSAAQEIIKKKLSVRETEKSVREKKDKKENKKPYEIFLLEEKLQNYFGTKTEINSKKQGGKIEIEFYSQEELERIMETLGIELD